MNTTTRFPWGAHRVNAELDAAYAREVDAFDGWACPPDHDGVPGYLEAAPAPEFGTVVVTVGGTNVRAEVGPSEARQLARLLDAAADALAAGAA